MDDEAKGEGAKEAEATSGRKSFLRTIFLMTGLAAAYGTAAAFALRFLMPGRRLIRKARMFIMLSDGLPPGQSTSFQTPDGEEYLLTNTGTGLKPLIAFSSRCPHLGCKVHWQDEKKQFYCPCHGGAFNAKGKATAGPPAAAGQSLKPCELKLEGKAIYALVERA